MFLLETGDLFFQQTGHVAIILQLLLQYICCSSGQFLANHQVVFQKQCSQTICDLSDLFRITALIRHCKGHIDHNLMFATPAGNPGAHHFHQDIFAHFTQNVLNRSIALKIRVESKVLNDLFQGLPAQDLLGYGPDTFFGIAGNSGANQVFWNLLRFNQNRGLGLIYGR
ncbi:hypothetical protein ES703_115545 [subsurface metagenome]